MNILNTKQQSADVFNNVNYTRRHKSQVHRKSTYIKYCDSLTTSQDQIDGIKDIRKT